jgi:hypothetical protein
MAALDSRIDELYQKPLDEFTAARNALAKTLAGSDAERVRKLPKPTVVPWAVNQLYWHERGVFDRLRKSGERLRAAQIAALKGRSSDMRGAADAHRNAIAEASQHALRLAERAGSRPDPDELTRTLEALSLAPELPEAPGRLTRPLQPAGFEALIGVVPATEIPPRLRRQNGGDAGGEKQTPARREAEREARRAETEKAEAEKAEAEKKKAEAALREAEAEMKQAEAAVERAEAELARATAAETKARAQLERAKQELVRRNRFRFS